MKMLDVYGSLLSILNFISFVHFTLCLGASLIFLSSPVSCK